MAWDVASAPASGRTATCPTSSRTERRSRPANVVVQVIDVSASSTIDAAGNPSPGVGLTGPGRAYVQRDGRMIVGRWQRETLDDVTTFVAKGGTEITPSPGRTWVEVFPSSIEVGVGEPEV
ncbi:MAG TPA: DUF3048 C-terminal domain-containing protein [Actinomycetota bacterium]